MLTIISVTEKKNSATRFKYSLTHTNRYLSYIFLDTCFNLQRSVITILVAKVISQTYFKLFTIPLPLL